MLLWVTQADDVTANYRLKRWRLAGGEAIALTIVVCYWLAFHAMQRTTVVSAAAAAAPQQPFMSRRRGTAAPLLLSPRASSRQ